MPRTIKIIDIPVESLHADSFSPYGIVIKELLHNRVAKFEMQNLGFEVDGTAELFIVSYPFQEMEFSKFERHHTMTEGRISLERAVVLVVAEDTPLNDCHSLPEPKSLRAFLLPGNQGIMFHKGTWHCIDCFPTEQGHADFAFFTEAESEEELLVFEDGDPENIQRSDLLDYKKERGVSFRITDPNGLLASVNNKIVSKT